MEHMGLSVTSRAVLVIRPGLFSLEVADGNKGQITARHGVDSAAIG
jgi:hypothetical protein